ncbi:MAG: hypothetical protein GIW98_02430 [Candidatus Eremiobacteraeota bacterium]|nr:hypothetical protein [Candidatus Eremiobacteraeota bacterium]
MINIRGAAQISVLLAFLFGGDGAPAVAAPTIIPGGANQTSGVSGNMSQVLFNGKLRIRGMSLREALPDEHYAHMSPPTAGQRAIILRLIVSNGTHHENHGYFNASLADVDGITITGSVLDEGWSLEPGAAARCAVGFNVPRDFIPTRIVLIQAAEPHPRAFRIGIRPGDFPVAAPFPAASP